MVATATTALISNLFLLPPYGKLQIESSVDLLRWSMLILSGILAGITGLIQRRLRLQASQDRQQAESLLQAERSLEKRLRMAELGARVGVWEYDPITTLLWMTPECEALYGVAPGTLTDHKRWQERIHPEDRSLVDGQLEGAMRGEAIDVEFRVLWPDGKVRWLYARGSAEHDAKGATVRFNGIDHDITLRKQAEQELARESEKNRLFLQHASDGIHILDAQGCLIQASDVFCQMLGYDHQELLGMHVSLWDVQLTETEILERIEQLLDQPDRSTFETRHRRKDGSIFDVEISAVPIDLAGQKTLFTSSRDITERKQAEKRLKENEQRLALAQEGAQLGFWELNLNNGRLYWSKQCEQLYGVSRESIRSHDDWLKMVHAEDRPLIEAQWEPISRHEPFEVEFRIRRPSGETRWLVSKGQATYDQAGQPLCLFGINQDITDKKLLTEELERSRLLMAEGERIAGLGTWEYEVASQNTIWSAEEFRIYGREADGLSPVYQDMLRECIHPDDAQELDRLFRLAVANAAPYEMQHKIIRPDGTERYVHDLAYPYFDAAGQLIKYIGTTLDITERKQIMDELADREAHLNLALDAAHAGS